MTTTAESNQYRTPALAFAVVAVGALVYRAALSTYFYNDDFQWLLAAKSFSWSNWLNPAARNHFFRPLPELYFVAARLVWDHSAPLFHLASITVHLVNACLVWRVATLLGRRRLFGFAALCFVVQPGCADAVTWVCSVSTVLAGTFYLTAVWFHARFVETRKPRWAALAVASFAGCLASHESSVMLLPLLYLVECVQAGRLTWPWEREGPTRLFTKYVPYVMLLSAYIAVEYFVNARNYVVTEGHYAPGFHVFKNLLTYLIGLHLGLHSTTGRILVVAAIAMLLAWGSGRVRFYTLWILLTLMPASFFTWGTAGRYQYLAAIGLSLLLAEAGVFTYDRLRPLVRQRLAGVAAIVLMGLIVGRSGVFAEKAVRTFQRTAEPYRRFLVEFQREHPSRPSGLVVINRPVPADLSPVYLEAALQLAYDDPTIRLAFRPPER